MWVEEKSVEINIMNTNVGTLELINIKIMLMYMNDNIKLLTSQTP